MHACALALALALAFPNAPAAETASQALREVQRMYRGGETALALQHVDQALTEHPADPALRFVRGALLSDAGQPTQAANVFTALTRDYPEMPEPYNNLAVLRAARGDLDGARTLLEDALRRDPDYAIAQENLGDVLVRQAQRAYAVAASAPRAGDELQRKLRLVRTIDAVPSR